MTHSSRFLTPTLHCILARCTALLLSHLHWFPVRLVPRLLTAFPESRQRPRTSPGVPMSVLAQVAHQRVRVSFPSFDPELNFSLSHVHTSIGTRSTDGPEPPPPPPKDYVPPPPGAVFGRPLKESLRCASVQIFSADASGRLYVSGYIPTVVAKWFVHLLFISLIPPFSFRPSFCFSLRKKSTHVHWAWAVVAYIVACS